MKNKIKYALMRQIRNKGVRNIISRVIAKKIGTETFSSKSTIFKNESENIKSELDENGFYIFNSNLDETVINKIKSKSNSLKCHDPYVKGVNFSVSEIPENTHVANFYSHDLMEIKEIAEIANDPAVLKIAADFLGCTPTLSSVNMWYSTPGKKSAQEAQNFHRDVDDYKFVKLFIYLTDVCLQSGPHVYVKGSSRSEKARKIRRYTDKEIVETFGEENILYLAKPKGSMFMVDTYGFHKGLLPEGKERLLLQFEYSLNPIFAYNYQKVKAPIDNYNEYVCRLFY